MNKGTKSRRRDKRAPESYRGRVRPAIDPDPQRGAFFDLDNTMMRGSSLFLLARGLYRRGFFSRRQVIRFALAQARFRLQGRERTHEIDALRETALSFVEGHSAAELRAIGQEIFDESMSGSLWAQTIELAQDHLDAGQRVWLVTATPVEVAEVLAERLGLTGALGTIAESIDGRYTGRLSGPLLHGAAKAEAVVALAESEGLDLSKCAAYSDSSNDIPLLSIVGYPCAINPDAALKRYARKAGWRVHDFRSARRAAKIAAPAVAIGGAIMGGVWRKRKPNERDQHR